MKTKIIKLTVMAVIAIMGLSESVQAAKYPITVLDDKHTYEEYFFEVYSEKLKDTEITTHFSGLATGSPALTVSSCEDWVNRNADVDLLRADFRFDPPGGVKAGDRVDKNQDQTSHMLQRDKYTILNIIDTRGGNHTSYDVSLKFDVFSNPKDLIQGISFDLSRSPEKTQWMSVREEDYRQKIVGINGNPYTVTLDVLPWNGSHNNDDYAQEIFFRIYKNEDKQDQSTLVGAAAPTTLGSAAPTPWPIIKR